MPDYKESSVAGTQWQRCHGVYLQNTYGQTPLITLREEQVTAIGDQTFFKDMGQMQFPFEQGATIPLLNPLTGQPTGGTITMGEVYAIMWSLYMQKAAERDAAQGATP